MFPPWDSPPGCIWERLSLRAAAASSTTPRPRHWCDAGLGPAIRESAPGGILPRATRTTELSHRCLANQSQRGPPPRPSPNVPLHTDSRPASTVRRPRRAAAAQSDSSAGSASLPNTLCSDPPLTVPPVAHSARTWPAPAGSPTRSAFDPLGPGECRVCVHIDNSIPSTQRACASHSCCTSPQSAPQSVAAPPCSSTHCRPASPPSPPLAVSAVAPRLAPHLTRVARVPRPSTGDSVAHPSRAPDTGAPSDRWSLRRPRESGPPPDNYNLDAPRSAHDSVGAHARSLSGSYSAGPLPDNRSHLTSRLPTPCSWDCSVLQLTLTIHILL